MSTPATSPQPAPAGDDRNLVPAEASPVVTFEDKMRGFWASYRKVVLALCALVVLGIVGKLVDVRPRNQNAVCLETALALGSKLSEVGS